MFSQSPSNTHTLVLLLTTNTWTRVRVKEILRQKTLVEAGDQSHEILFDRPWNAIQGYFLCRMCRLISAWGGMAGLTHRCRFILKKPVKWGFYSHRGETQWIVPSHLLLEFSSKRRKRKKRLFAKKFIFELYFGFFWTWQSERWETYCDAATQNLHEDVGLGSTTSSRFCVFNLSVKRYSEIHNPHWTPPVFTLFSRYLNSIKHLIIC